MKAIEKAKSFLKKYRHAWVLLYFMIYMPWFVYLEKRTNVRHYICLLYTSPSPRDLSTSRMPSSA